MTGVAHLARRFIASLSKAEPVPTDETWAQSHLLPAEVALWKLMSAPDRRHAITVARRFAAQGGWSRDEIAGALLHDVGKVVADLGTAARVVATIIGPRTRRFRQYHDHEAIGAAMLRDAGSSPVTLDLVAGKGRAADALRRADHV